MTGFEKTYLEIQRLGTEYAFENLPELEEQLKDDIIDDFIYENKDKNGFPKRELWDFIEVSREENDEEEFLRFGLWSEMV